MPNHVITIDKTAVPPNVVVSMPDGIAIGSFPVTADLTLEQIDAKAEALVSTYEAELLVKAQEEQGAAALLTKAEALEAALEAKDGK